MVNKGTLEKLCPWAREMQGLAALSLLQQDNI